MKKNYQNFFSVIALILCAIFTQYSNAQCTGGGTTSIDGAAFSAGYTYSFSTTGTDVTITFRLLDTDKTGVVGYVFKRDVDNANFSENGVLFPNANNEISKTFDGLAIGTTYKFAAKFAFAGGMSVTEYFEYTVGDNCTAVPVDTAKPTAFTASVGAISPFSVALVLNATDDSGAVTYKVTGGATASISGNSGATKTLIIRNLTPETAYNFSVIATDAAGNDTTAIPLSATTTKDNSTACAGTSSVASEGTFSSGFDYSITTAGTDVTVSFTLIDTDKNGVVAYVFKRDVDDTNFSENGPLYPVAGNISKTFNGLVNGTTYEFAVKFAYAGGLVTTKYFTYTVGDACATALGTNDVQLSDNAIKLYPNPANKGIVTVEAGDLKVSKVEVYSILGAKVLETNKTTIATNGLQAGVYFVKISAEGKSVTKKLIVN